MVPSTQDEMLRLQALRGLDLACGAPDPRADALCRAAARLVGAPIALVSVLDAERAWVKGRCGLDVVDVPRDVSFCAHAILADEPTVVEDARLDPRFRNNPFVTGEPGVRFYAGAPIAIGSGVRIGTLCVIDRVPRALSAQDRRALADLAAVAGAILRGGAVGWLDEILSAQERLRATTELLALAQEAAGAGTFDWDMTTGRARLSRESLRLLGLPHEEDAEITEERFAAAVEPADLPEVFAAGRAAAAGAPYRVEFRVPLDGGGARWIMGVGRHMRDPATGSDRMLGLNIDITERRLAEEALRERERRLAASEERLAFALEATSDGVWDWDVTTGAVLFSERWAAMLGFSPHEVEPHVSSWERLVHPDDRAYVDAVLSAHLEGRTPTYECEHRVRHKDGSWRWILDRGRVVSRDAAGRPLRAVGTHSDVTARREAERRAEHMARHDPLTDLPNRAFFRERLDLALARARDGGAPVALMTLDLDRFKPINDTLGHPVGDAVLRAVAARLRAELRGVDVIARLGGDEFAVLQASGRQPQAARELAGRLVEAVAAPIRVDGRDLSVGVSIGVAVAPQDGRDADELLKNADLALYRAKSEGRSTARFFEAAMDAAARARRELEIDLREATAREAFLLHFQPQLDVASGRVAAFEALVRWPHPTRGLVPPDEFIPVAEETKLIGPIGLHVLRAACAAAARWPNGVRVAVNVSGVELDRGDYVDGVASALARSGLAPHRLELEITESVLVRDSDTVLRALQALRALGVRIALDDFGTGYSSLGYLRRFPFDKIKIDRSFVRDLDDPNTAAIVRAIVGLGARLGAEIAAEGVETPLQLERARAEGCSLAQGWLVGRPAPEPEAIARLGLAAA